MQMSVNNSESFERVVRDLETRLSSLTDKRRSYTKNLVAQTNDEVRSGMPYIVDVASTISQANSAELFLDSLINSLRSESLTLGESVALKRALNSVIENVRYLGSKERNDAPSATDLYEIGHTLMGSLSGVQIRKE